MTLDELKRTCEGYWVYVETIQGPRPAAQKGFFQRLADRFVQSAQDPMMEVRRGYMEASSQLFGMGPETLPWALQLLERDIPEAREMGAGLLSNLASRGQLGESYEEVIERLVQAFQRRPESDRDRTARLSVLRALARTGHPRGVMALAQVMEFPDGEYRREALHSVAQMLAEAAGQPFLDADDPIAAARDWVASKGGPAAVAGAMPEAPRAAPSPPPAPAPEPPPPPPAAAPQEEAPRFRQPFIPGRRQS